MTRENMRRSRPWPADMAAITAAVLVSLVSARAIAVEPASLPSSAGAACGLSEPEARLAELLTGTEQRRPVLRCRPELQRFARQRAEDMARRGYLAHFTPDRKGPNQQLRAAGYPLPPAYRDGLSNNVESIAGGIRSPEVVWDALTASSSHRAHLLGEHPAYLEQDEFGIAYQRDLYAPHVDYWVVVIARKARTGEDEFICTPEPAECFRVAAQTRSSP